MTTRPMSWFKRGIAYDVKFTGIKNNNRCWNRITVFVYEDDRQEAVREACKQAAMYGYQNVTVDHMVKLS